MNRRHLLAALLSSMLCVGATAEDMQSLRLVPFPKEIRANKGCFDLSLPLSLSVSEEYAEVILGLLKPELQRAGFKAPSVTKLNSSACVVTLASTSQVIDVKSALKKETKEEEYSVTVDKNTITCASNDIKGLLHGVQTLCQLIRANRTSNTIPCLSINDWPSLKWRGYAIDMTRGPSAKLETLKYQVNLSSYVKMNIYSYYMENQYAFSKHPTIGPVDGSFTPAELKELVAYAATRRVEILGNQQSFGHLATILRSEKYGHLAEYGSYTDKSPGNRWSLSPALEESYQFLDELYSEQIPLLPFGMFNVNCDEVMGIGSGSAADMVAQYGVGGVYVKHMQRIHDILKNKYGKRMMMWGDIIGHHPDKLDQIPKDTVMMAWDYRTIPSFEAGIRPYAKSGYDFFVCPSVLGWSRVLPDFKCATINIQNFVRDGAKLGALGMLNTDWKDDGQTLNAPLYHGFAWGAECAWNGSTTAPADFNRRIGAVVFGENGDHFGKAIELLGETTNIRGVSDVGYPSNGFLNQKYWANDFQSTLDPEVIIASAEKVLSLVRPAKKHLEDCRKDAQVNAELLDAFVFGASRMEWVGQRMLDGAEVVKEYTKIYDNESPQAASVLEKIKALIKKNRDISVELAKQYPGLWQRENKTYAMDGFANRQAGLLRQFDGLLSRIDDAIQRIATGKPLLAPAAIGLGSSSMVRKTWEDKQLNKPLAPDAPWDEATASHRLGLVIDAGNAERLTLPIELDVALPADLRSKPVRAFCSIASGPATEIPAQLDPVEVSSRTRLTLVIPGLIPAKAQASVQVYLGLSKKPEALPQAVFTQNDPNGMKWMENDKLRLLLGSEGAHIDRWEVKALGGRDITQPGTKGWSGFSDVMGKERALQYQLVCLANGPALVRYQCTSTSGAKKQISLFAGASWIEETMREIKEGYTHYDDVKNFSGTSSTPGKYLFSDGKSGAVGKETDGASAQIRVSATWSIKYNDQKLALGLITPEAKTTHVIGPGGQWGGAGINGAPPVHVITFAGVLEDEPEVTMKRLQQTLDLNRQPSTSLFDLEKRK